MTCRHFLELLDRMDNIDIQEEMAAHAASCPGCAAELSAVMAGLRLYRLPDVCCSANLVPRIMAMLPLVPAPKRLVSMRNWVLAGLLIMGSVVLVPFMSDFRVLKETFGPAFTIPVSMAFGLIITIYSGIFVISHIDEFGRRLKAYEAVKSGKIA
ncbi:hypothetical protein MASR2M29_22950 [Spirochaetota bacterium]